MRICIVSQYFPPDVGGASTRVSNAIKGLRRKGHEIFVVTAFPHYPHGHVPGHYSGRAFAVEGDEKVRVFRVWVPPLPHVGGARRFIMYASFTLFSLIALPFSGEIDVVWTVSPNYFCSFSGAVYKMMKRRPFVLDEVDIWPEAVENLGFLKSELIVKLVGWSVAALYRLSDAIVTLSVDMKGEITKRAKDASKVHIVENVVDTDVFKPYVWRRGKDFAKKFVVMYVGNLGKAQDFDTVLESAKILENTAPEVIFFLKGKGDCEGEIAAKIDALKLRNVILSNSAVQLEEVPNYLNLADALLLPLKRGFGNISFPSKLWEYLACRKPVIAEVEGNIAKFIGRNKIGIITAPGDSIGLSKSILELKESKQLREVTAESGFRFAVENASLDVIGEKLVQVFERASQGESDSASWSTEVGRLEIAT